MKKFEVPVNVIISLDFEAESKEDAYEQAKLTMFYASIDDLEHCVDIGQPVEVTES